jgi:hypothetical protein
MKNRPLLINAPVLYASKFRVLYWKRTRYASGTITAHYMSKLPDKLFHFELRKYDDGMRTLTIREPEQVIWMNDSPRAGNFGIYYICPFCGDHREAIYLNEDDIWGCFKCKGFTYMYPKVIEQIANHPDQMLERMNSAITAREKLIFIKAYIILILKFLLAIRGRRKTMRLRRYEARYFKRLLLS